MGVDQSYPSFLRARSPQGLQRLMLSNNARFGMFFKYFDIQWHPEEKRWYAWFFKDFRAVSDMVKGEPNQESDQ